MFRGKNVTRCETEEPSDFSKTFILQEPPTFINYNKLEILPCPLSLSSSVRTNKKLSSIFKYGDTLLLF